MRADGDAPRSSVPVRDRGQCHAGLRGTRVLSALAALGQPEVSQFCLRVRSCAAGLGDVARVLRWRDVPQSGPSPGR